MTRRLSLSVIIDQIETPCRSVRSTHDVDQPIATGSITMRAPRPAHVQPGAPVGIWCGYDGATAMIFHGNVADSEAAFDERGGLLTVELEGFSKRLSYKPNTELGFIGPMSLNVWWRSMCNHFEMPYYQADETYAPDGVTEITLGDNPDIGAWLPIRTDRPPLSDMTRIPALFGYRHFDTPDGTARLQRVSGYPTEWETPDDLPLYAEGENVLRIERSRSMQGVYNVIDVRGAEYLSSTLGEQAIRSFTGTYTPEPLFGPGQVSTLVLRDDTLDTVDLADAAREAHEIDLGAEQRRWRWTCVGGDNARRPGDQVRVQGSTVKGPDGPDLDDLIVQLLPAAVWVTRVEQNVSERGWTTTMEGWTGNGQALPAGNDCATQTILAGSVHIGNEYLTHYRNPSPSGLEYSVDFTVADDYTTANVYFDAHGTNSFLMSTDSTASRFEVWQGGERKMSGEMPRQNENLANRYPYGDATGTVLEDGSVVTTDDYFWHKGLVVPLSGQLDVGTATFKIISGRDADVGDYDDYEVKNVRIQLCGVGVPAPAS